MRQPRWVAMLNSPRLKGSAMFALLGTLSNLVSVVPSPVRAEWLMFASSFEDGMFGGLIVPKLDVWCCE